MHFKHISAKI